MAAINKENSYANSDLDSLKVSGLRQFLRLRGVQISGTKTELLARAKGLRDLNVRPLSELQIEDLENQQVRANEKFRTPLGEKLPEPESLHANWTSNTSQIPPFRQEDIFQYLVLNKMRTFDSKCMNAKRQLKAKVFFEDKHVHSVKYNDINEQCSHCYVKCKVIPSLPTGTEKQKPDYDVWVCQSKINGNIHAAGCTCSAGEGESCNHIAALLYALTDINERKKDGLDASTSNVCKWNQPRKRKMSPTKVQNLVFKKCKYSDTPSRENKVRSAPIRVDSTESIEPIDVHAFNEKLKICAPFAAFLLNYDETKTDARDENIEVSEHLHNIDFCFMDNIDLSGEDVKTHFDNYFSSLKISVEGCEVIDRLTMGQSNNKLWASCRYGRLTSSIFGRIFKLKTDTPPDNTLKTVLQYTEFSTSSVQWGKTHERAARRSYINHITKTHPLMKVHLCGLKVNNLWPHLGSSPDALLHCSHCSDSLGVLEIKCPYKYRFASPIDAGRDKSFCCEIVDDKLRLKRSHDYYFQVMGQMAITGRKWCDFVIWTTKGISWERIEYNPEVWSTMLLKLNMFFKTAVLPELFSQRVKRGIKLYK